MQADGTHHWVRHITAGRTVVPLLAEVLRLRQPARLTVPAGRTLRALSPVCEVCVVRPGRVWTAERDVRADWTVESHWALGGVGHGRADDAEVSCIAQSSRFRLLKTVAVVPCKYTEIAHVHYTV